MLKIILILMSLLVSAGCVAPNKFINAGYKISRPNKAISVIPLIPSVISVENIDDFYEDFADDKRDFKEVLVDTTYKYISKRIEKNLQKNNLIMINSSTCKDWIVDSLRFFNVQKKFVNDSILINYYVLRKEYFNDLFPNSDIGITINSLKISRTSGTITFGGPPMFTIDEDGFTPGGKPTGPGLEAAIKFVVWDYQQNEIVSSGEFLTLAEINFFVLTPNTWRTLFELIGYGIISNTPFYEKKIKKVHARRN